MPFLRITQMLTLPALTAVTTVIALALPAMGQEPTLPPTSGYPATGEATYPAPMLDLIRAQPGPTETKEPLPPPLSEIPPPSSPSAPPAESVVPEIAPITPMEAPSSPAAEVIPSDPTSADVEGQLPIGESTSQAEAPPSWYQPVYWLGVVPWDTGLEFGLNGSSGTSESLSLRFGGYMRRESEFSKIDMNANYNRTNAGGVETQNNAQFSVRNDWLFSSNSPWSLFGLGTIFYDEFQAFDLQANISGGVGYQWIDREGLQLTTRLGSGAMREFGGPDDAWKPEGQAGIEYEQRIASNQKLIAKVDYFPQWDDLSEYRLVTDIGWEVELVRPSNMSLKISATDRYDSTPNGADPHNTNYSVLLIWKL